MTPEEQAARIAELEASLQACGAYVGIGPNEGDLPIPERVRRTVNRLNGSIGYYERRIRDLEGTVATLREIAIGEKASALFNGPWDGGLPTGASYDAVMRKAKEDARHQLEEEHPEAFR